MSQPKRQVCFNITEFERHSIRSLFTHSKWNFDSCIVLNNWVVDDRDEEITAGQNESVSCDNNPGIKQQVVILDMAVIMQCQRLMARNVHIVIATHA